jgi:diacylglycerol O-acyltransferase / wax synthase
MGQTEAVTSAPAAVADRLSREDAQILKLERGPIRGHTVKIIVLERTGDRALPTIDEIRENFAAGLDEAPRLRQRLAPVPLHLAQPVWVDDPEFDIARHIRLVETRGPVGHAGLEEIVARLMTDRLDRGRPLWRLDVIERIDEDTMGLVLRLHHCLADGTTSMRFCGCVLWSEDPEAQCCTPAPWTPAPAPSGASLLAQALSEHWHRSRQAAADDGGGASAAVRLTREAIVRELRPGAAVTPLAARAGPSRVVSLSSMPLAPLKAAGKRIDETVTVNDVVLAVIAGGLRAWLERGHGPAEGIRVKIPVSLHEHGEAATVANRDSYMFVDLPVAEPDVRQRVLAIHRETEQRKLDHDAETLYRLGAHPFIARWAMSPRVFTFNISNVRGPANDLYVLGAHVRDMYSLAEIAQQHVLRVAVVSASGRLSFGLSGCAEAVKDIGVMADGLRRTADELIALDG